MKLKDVKVAILVADGFEKVELTEPKKALEKEGADVIIVSPNAKKVKSWDKDNWGEEMSVDLNIKDADVVNFDALVLPGGRINPDYLRVNQDVVKFVKSFFTAGHPVGVICHGVWTLVETGILEGRNVTSYHSIKTDLINAGANWVDQEVVVDGGLITSRNPGDLKAFNKKLIEEFSLAAQE